MKILIVCGGNPVNGSFIFEIHQSFINEQMKEMRKYGYEFDVFLIRGKGILGYLKNIGAYWKTLLSNHYAFVHAHDGTAGIFAVLQFFVPVLITFHGSDIFHERLLRFSRIAMNVSRYNIFVHQKLIDVSGYRRNNSAVIPCGYDSEIFFPIPKEKARGLLGIDNEKKIVLFSSSFTEGTPKNYELAKTVISAVTHPDVVFMPLTGYSRSEVNLLFNAVDVLLITSHWETGPLIVKEALACNCPVVSVDVGYVKEVMASVNGCFVCGHSVNELSQALDTVLKRGKRVESSMAMVQYSNAGVCKSINEIYKTMVRT